jgi:hypothetical protein
LTAPHFKMLARPSGGGSGRYRTIPASRPQQGEPAREEPEPQGPDLSIPLKDYLEKAEEVYLEAALRRTRGHVHNAARLAGLSRRTLSRKIKKFDLHREARIPEGVPAPRAVFWLSAPPLQPYRLDPAKDELTLGRAQGCDFVFPLPGISRVHARLRREPEGWLLEDAGSRNGTRLNGKRLTEPELLGEGDIVDIDTLRFRVVVSPGEPEPYTSTTRHLVRGQLDQVSLSSLVKRIGSFNGSARIDVTSPKGSGHLKLVDGELLWANFENREEGQCVGDAAMKRLEALSDGLFVVTGSSELNDYGLLPTPDHVDLVSTHRDTRSVDRRRLQELVDDALDGDETDLREIDPHF